MTLAQCIDRARTLSRTTVSGLNDTKAMEWVNEAQYQFSKDVHNLIKTTFLEVKPLIDLDDTMGVHFHITGGALDGVDSTYFSSLSQIGNDPSDGSVDAIANAWFAGIPGAFTSQWDPGSGTTWHFTWTFVNATSVTISNPGDTDEEYTSILPAFGMTAGTYTDDAGAGSVVITGTLPLNSTALVDLPSDFIEIKPSPEWDGDPLYPVPMDFILSTDEEGVPRYYSIEQKQIRLYPCPNYQGEFKIRYKYLPSPFLRMAGYQDCGCDPQVTPITLITTSNLAASTTYTFMLRIDVGASTQRSITTASDLSFSAIIALLNAATPGATWSIVDGDLRCTSDTLGASSAIAIGVTPTSGTPFFNAAGAGGRPVQNWAALETAATNQANDDLVIAEEYCSAVVFYTAMLMALGNFEEKIADKMYSMYRREVQRVTIQQTNNQPKMEPSAFVSIPNYEVIP